MNKKIKENFNLIIVHTNSSKEILTEEYDFPEKKVVVLPMWAPEIKIVKEDSRIKKLKSEKKKVVLCWGFISPHKNYESVIKAMKNLPEKINLIIAGSPHPNSLERDERYISYLKTLAKKFNVEKRVIFIDRFLEQKAIDSLIYSSDLVILPYKTITTSAVFYRSLALKKPILASSIAFFNEINKEYGYPELFNSEKNISNLIHLVLEDKKYQKGLILGLNRCLRDSRLKNITKEYGKIYSRLIV